MYKIVVGAERLELSLPKKRDFESRVSTISPRARISKSILTETLHQNRITCISVSPIYFNNYLLSFFSVLSVKVCSMNDTLEIAADNTPRKISEVLIDLKTELTAEKVCTFDLLQALHERGFGFLLFIFALPAAIPLPGLGINIVIALPLLFLTAQQALGRHSIWIPNWMKYKSISKQQFETIVDKSLPLIKRAEFFVRPRLGFITQDPCSILIGLLGLLMALSICVPLPLTNTVPAMGIALMALGVVMRDGLAVIGGAILGTAWVFMIFFVIIFLGVEGVDLVKETIKGWL